MTTTAFDLDALRRAIETNDADAQVAAYGDDAELTVVDSQHTPTNPQVLRGRAAIEEHIRDVTGRNMTHQVSDVVVGEGRVAFTEHCEYSDGTRVLCATVADVTDGRISRQIAVQAWDA
jgi:hypothetical protein